MAKPLIEICTSVVVAQASRTLLSSEDIADSLHQIFRTLKDLHQQEHRTEGGVSNSGSPQNSIQRNRVICLECQKEFKLLSNRHLALHGMSSRDYKLKWGLPLRQPLSSKSLTLTRRKIAKEKGLGAKLVAYRKRKA